MGFADIVAECKKTGKLYEDKEFDAVNSNIFFSRDPPRPFIWKRPKEIVSDAQFLVGGGSRFDIKQGMLGDCWLLSAIASLTLKESLLNRVIENNEPFDSRDYCGAIRFKLWCEGEWTEVVIDDRLPTYNGKLVFMHSPEKGEFWSALLEKAMAKLAGSYEGLKGGQMAEGMCMLTGGIMETFDLGDKAPEGLFRTMLRAVQRHSLMGCSIAAKPNEIEAKGDLGLVKGHAYSVTDAKKLHAKTRHGELIEEMVRVRNPWGNEREWKGAWSDGSSEWHLLADDEKRQIGLTFEDDGEFWMTYKDFIKHFSLLEMCNLSAGSGLDEGTTKVGYATFQDKGRWVRGSSAGGCRNFISSFASNPQYRVKLEDTDDDEDDLCTVVVSLMQMRRRQLKRVGGQFLTIGFSIYKLEEEQYLQASILDKEFFSYHASTERSPQFINSNEVCGRYKLTPGEYVVIPCTFEPNQEGEFLLRIFSEKPKSARRADQQTKFERQQSVARPEDKDMNDKFFKMFEKLAGADAEIDEFELQQILSAAFKADLLGKELSQECCKGIVSLYDKEDSNYKLSYSDFKTMWVEIRKIKTTFASFDVNNDDTMDIYELRSALRDQGFSLSNGILSAIQARFKTRDNKINFEAFVTAIIRLKTLDRKLDLLGQGYKTMSLDEMIGACMTI